MTVTEIVTAPAETETMESVKKIQSLFAIEELPATESSDDTHERRHTYVLGIYGILAIESFLWTYLQTFIPAVVSSSTSGPGYQTVVRAIFSVPLWNASLIYNFFIVLSLRNIAVSFLSRPTGQSYSATVVRRFVRLPLVVCAASGMATLIFSQIGVEHIDQFKKALPNNSITTPSTAFDVLAAFNSLFNFFWITTGFFTQAANSFWPTATLWVQSVIYYQSFTTYFLMVILPFTRPRWHFSGMALFAIGCFWMESWGWYSATGLLLADVAVDETMRDEFLRGLQLKAGYRLPYWTIATLSAAVGVALKYVFTVCPQDINAMLVLHPYLDLSSNHSASSVAAEGPYARVDDWLLIVGIMLAVELFPRLRRALSSKPLVWIGERAFSLFTAQCMVLWTAGIKIWLMMREDNRVTISGANTVVFLACLVTTLAFAELFYRIVDRPSRWAANSFYRWLTT